MPLDLITILAFLPASLALNLTPGVDMLFCAAQGMRAGPRSAIAASAGIALGGLIHALVAGLGFAALIAAVPGLLDVVLWAGVAYLLWLAWQSLGAEPGRFSVAGLSPGRAFVDGLFVNLANPKVLLFVLAFLPQFVAPDRPLIPQFLALGAILAAGGLIINGLVGVFAARAATRLATSRGTQVWIGRLTALIFVLLALWLALSQISG